MPRVRKVRQAVSTAENSQKVRFKQSHAPTEGLNIELPVDRVDGDESQMALQDRQLVVEEIHVELDGGLKFIADRQTRTPSSHPHILPLTTQV